MDEMKNLSWRARLAKANVNILSITLEKTPQGITHRWFVEFTYHPKPGTFKWCKTYIDVPQQTDYAQQGTQGDPDPIKGAYRTIDMDEVAQFILDKVLSLRKELEG